VLTVWARGGPRAKTCPISGRKLPNGAAQVTIGSVSAVHEVDEVLVDHVALTTGLAPEVARRVVEDVLAFHAEPVADYVRRRHGELRTHGARNPEIWARIGAELAGRPVAAPHLSERQLRRLVYGG